MLTQCPKCRTIYQLGAADLSAASGYVECGECDTQFNALARLADEPAFAASVDPEPAPAAEPGPAFVLLDPGDVEPGANAETEAEPAPEPDPEPDPDLDPRSDPDAEPEPEPAPEAEPEFITPAAADDGRDVPASVPAPAKIEVDGEDAALEIADELLEFDPDADDLPAYVTPEAPEDDLAEAPAPPPAADEAVIDFAGVTATQNAAHTPAIDDEPAGMAPLRPATSVLNEAEHAILFTEPETDDEADNDDDGDGDEITEPFSIDEVPAVIQDEVAALHRAPRRRWRWFWVLLALALTGLFVIQIVLGARTEIANAAPALSPLIDAACARFGCAARAGEPAAIELIARDVRDHPQFRDTLLVNATLVSRAENPVPFPVLQLGLQGPTGEVLGIRRFEPHEYLDRSIDMAAGMPPNRAVYIVLEVAQTGSRAVSFEFDFL